MWPPPQGVARNCRRRGHGPLICALAYRRPVTRALASDRFCASTRAPGFNVRDEFDELLPEKDRLWTVDQVMEIESPEAVTALGKTLAGLFHPDSGATRRRH